MKTMQSELVKHRQFVSNLAHSDSEIRAQRDVKEQNNFTSYPNTVSRTRNVRNKRTSEEVRYDVEKVINMVNSGKFHVIEALEEVGLKSSVFYKYFRDQGIPAPYTVKAKNFPPTRNTPVKEKLAPKNDEPKKADKEDFERRVEMLRQEESNHVILIKKLEKELVSLREKYIKLANHVIDVEILKEQ